jgi:hypothetical protein
MAGQAADAFGTHGVAFVRHGGGADLSGLEGLLEFLFGVSVSKRVLNEHQKNESLTLRLASSRMSVASLWAVAPRDASGARTSTSILRE